MAPTSGARLYSGPPRLRRRLRSAGVAPGLRSRLRECSGATLAALLRRRSHAAFSDLRERPERARGLRQGGVDRLDLDRFVAIALNTLHGWSLPERGGWSPETYGRWWDRAHGLAHQESERTDAVVWADAVEMAHFYQGRNVAGMRRANAAH